MVTGIMLLYNTCNQHVISDISDENEIKLKTQIHVIQMCLCFSIHVHLHSEPTFCQLHAHFSHDENEIKFKT
jgi:hypothetical protein